MGIPRRADDGDVFGLRGDGVIWCRRCLQNADTCECVRVLSGDLETRTSLGLPVGTEEPPTVFHLGPERARRERAARAARKRFKEWCEMADGGDRES
jgi:hypothetical protein